MNFAEAIKNDMRPALGVTEPAAIALACAQARKLTEEEPKEVFVEVNSGIYKNAYTCGIPNTSVVGNEFAAALGCWYGFADRNLMVLDQINSENVEFCRDKILKKKVTIQLGEISSEISIKARIITEHDVCEAHIEGSHTNVCYLKKNDQVLRNDVHFSASSSKEESAEIESVSLLDIYEFAANTPIDNLFFIKEAFTVNGKLAEAGLNSEKCSFAHKLFELNGQRLISDDAERTALLLSAAAAEARVLGLNYPAMSITGSGNHGIICTMPLYAVAQVENLNEEKLLRATALSYLVTMYIKHYSGILSALCGCAVAAGTGMACGLTMMRGGEYSAICATLNNMANSIVGMICQGGNHGCVMKVISAVKTGFSASELSIMGAHIEACHGIGDRTPEQTMRNIGLIANPGMVETEKTIVDILVNKQCMYNQ